MGRTSSDGYYNGISVIGRVQLEYTSEDSTFPMSTSYRVGLLHWSSYGSLQTLKFLISLLFVILTVIICREY